MARAARAPAATPDRTPAPTTSAAWREFIAGLHARAEAATARQSDLRTERDGFALDLELGDPAAVDAAAVLDEELAGVAREVAQIVAATASAERRLKASEADEIAGVRAERATELLAVLAERPLVAQLFDTALAQLFELADRFVETTLKIEALSPEGVNNYVRGRMIFDVITTKLCPLASLGIEELTPPPRDLRKTLSEHVSYVDRHHAAWATSVLNPDPAQAA